jgi:hypothetical protein
MDESSFHGLMALRMMESAAWVRNMEEERTLLRMENYTMATMSMVKKKDLEASHKEIGNTEDNLKAEREKVMACKFGATKPMMENGPTTKHMARVESFGRMDRPILANSKWENTMVLVVRICSRR